jgi:hypothetical protein
MSADGGKRLHIAWILLLILYAAMHTDRAGGRSPAPAASGAKAQARLPAIRHPSRLILLSLVDLPPHNRRAMRKLPSLAKGRA